METLRSTCEHNDSCFYLLRLSTRDLLQRQSASHSRATRSHLIAACYSCGTVDLTLDPWASPVGVGGGKRLAREQSTFLIAFIQLIVIQCKIEVVVVFNVFSDLKRKERDAWSHLTLLSVTKTQSRPFEVNVQHNPKQTSGKYPREQQRIVSLNKRR